MVETHGVQTSDPVQVERGDRLVQHVVRLNRAERAYFRRRAVEEADAGKAAACPEARLAHEQMAAAYRKLSIAGIKEADQRLGGELPPFLLNPKAAN